MLGESEGASTGKSLIPFLWAAGICTKEVQFHGMACFDSEGARNAPIEALAQMGTIGQLTVGMEDSASHPLLHGLYVWSKAAEEAGVCDGEFTRYVEQQIMKLPLNIQTGNFIKGIKMTTLTSERIQV